LPGNLKLSALLFWATAWILGQGCSASHQSLVDSLEEIGKADLQDILNDLPPTAKGSVLAKPYFVRDEFEQFKGDSSIVYQARAVLVFFYLDPTLNLCQVRKYRYRTTSGFWDRYDVKLIHIPEKFTGVEAH
jgi:hypothetical protein